MLMYMKSDIDLGHDHIMGVDILFSIKKYVKKIYVKFHSSVIWQTKKHAHVSSFVTFIWFTTHFHQEQNSMLTLCTTTTPY